MGECRGKKDAVHACLDVFVGVMQVQNRKKKEFLEVEVKEEIEERKEDCVEFKVVK